MRTGETASGQRAYAGFKNVAVERVKKHFTIFRAWILDAFNRITRICAIEKWNCHVSSRGQDENLA